MLTPFVFKEVNAIGVVVTSSQNNMSLIVFTCASGFIMMLNTFGVPIQLIPFKVYVGVTSIVAIMGAFVLFCVIKLGIFPIPLLANPIEGVLFVQT